MSGSASTGTPRAAYPQYVPAKFERLFLFNPRFGPKEETADEKLLFYYPASATPAIKFSDIGLSEALANVTKTFTDLPVETMRTLKCRWTLLMPEQGYWMGMVFRNARLVRKEGAEPEYLDDELNDLAISALLKRTYNTFKLFNGTLEGLYQQTQDLPKFRESLSSAFAKLIPSLTAEDADLFSTMDGIHFLSVNKNVFLQIQSFVNSVESSFDMIKNTVFMFRDHMVWSGLEQEDMRALYKYVNEQRRQGKFPQKQMGFLMGPDDATLPPSLKIYTGATDGSSPSPLSLAVFVFAELVCLFLVDPPALKPSFFGLLQDFMLPQLQYIGQNVTQQVAQLQKAKPTVEDTYRYIYFNHMNLALKTTLKGKALELSKDMMAALNQMHQDFEQGAGSSAEQIQEVMVRTQANIWIVGKKSDQREFYVIFDQDSRNLLEVTEEVKKLSQTHFGSIFID